MKARPTTANLLTTIEAMVMTAIERAANANVPCPKNSDLADAMGAMSSSAPIPIMRSLEAKGLIIVRRFGMAREVEIVATGRRTLHEGSRKPHWRAAAVDVVKAEVSAEAALAGQRRHDARRQNSLPVVPREPVESSADRPRVARDPCPRCGARGDVDCGHPRAWPAWAGGSFGSTASSLA